jgi:hypothetical protein
MKFSKLRQLSPVLSIGLLVATLLTACSITTIDYVFVASSSGIQTFAADSQSGALSPPTMRTSISPIRAQAPRPARLSTTPSD